MSDSPPSGFSSIVAALRSGRKAYSSMLKNTSTFLTKDLDLEEHPIETKHVNEKRVSPFDVLHQHQIEA